MCVNDGNGSVDSPWNLCYTILYAWCLVVNYLQCIFSTRLQDQGSACKDQHVHQDTSSRRRSHFRYHGPSGRRVCSETGNPRRRGPLYTDTGSAEKHFKPFPKQLRVCRREQSHHLCTSALPRRGVGRWTQGSHS